MLLARLECLVRLNRTEDCRYEAVGIGSVRVRRIGPQTPSPRGRTRGVRTDPLGGKRRTTFSGTPHRGICRQIDWEGSTRSSIWRANRSPRVAGTPAKKKRILDSRVQGTQLLAHTLAELDVTDRPSVFVSASAIGFYGDRGDEELTEDSAAGSMFLSRVCREWEEASSAAASGRHPRRPSSPWC